MDEEVYIDGDTVVTSIKRAGDTGYTVVGCSTGDNFNVSRTTTKTANKCNYGWSSTSKGSATWEVTQTGEAIIVDEEGNPAPSRFSFQQLLKLSITGEIFSVKMANEDGSIYREGNCRLTSYQEAAPVDGHMTYNATFEGIGEPIVENPETT
ncbi:Predicted secreted protein [Arachidicoccus rhizosphaerae]|uniref:Predicted secreted protein n=1 Tax=Arachidicoccus rhizosphaerae TaxID=551991 RepID=A0A1H3W730_9BACT|nr:phage tail tube protein [Arachidicoccus rhizosphaerae]SDZ82162.1 Predicted secreted protein [Arachidicoccus rhizosphaerae]